MLFDLAHRKMLKEPMRSTRQAFLRSRGRRLHPWSAAASGCVAVTGAALALMACSGTQPGQSVVCTMEARSSFAVTVVDSVSGVNLAPSAVVRVAPLARPDSIVDLVATSGVYSGGLYERAGRFELSVSRAGYLPWRMADVQVDQDECHVITRTLTARLRPAA